MKSRRPSADPVSRLSLGFICAASSVLCSCGGISAGSGNTNPAPPPQTDSISGTVTLKVQQLSEVTLTNLETNDNSVFATTASDASGNYKFSGMQTTGNVPGEYQVWANKAGYGFYPSVGSGAKVTRADYTGQFVQSASPEIAIYFTVIDFVALPNASVSDANFTAYDGSNPTITLARTGQQTSYFAGDDAAQQKGTAWPASRFIDNQNGTVTDMLTGLLWLKDAGCLGNALWANALIVANQLANGSCGLTDGSSGGQWRLPNLGELESIVDVSASNPAVTAGSPFVHVANAIYWSSTSYFGGEEGSPNAWSIRFSDGRYMNDSTSNLKASANNAVWAVKGTGTGATKLQSTGMYIIFATGDDGSYQFGVPLTYPRWIDNGNGTVTDTVSGLVWLKQANCIYSSWSSALTAVNSLASGQCGLADGSTPGSWRMPNRNEMQSLSDRMVTNHAAFFDTTYLNHSGTVYQSAIFTSFIESQFYWTSTTNASDTTEAWTVYSCDFGVYDTPKANSGYTLAVRSFSAN